MTLMEFNGSSKNTMTASRVNSYRWAGDRRMLVVRLSPLRSYVLPTGVSSGSLKINRRWSARFSATIRTFAELSSCLRSISGKSPSGAASATSTATCARFSRSISQFNRKKASDGTKMKISASITNSTVNSSNFDDKLRLLADREFAAAVAAGSKLNSGRVFKGLPCPG